MPQKFSFPHWWSAHVYIILTEKFDLWRNSHAYPLIQLLEKISNHWPLGKSSKCCRCHYSMCIIAVMSLECYGVSNLWHRAGTFKLLVQANNKENYILLVLYEVFPWKGHVMTSSCFRCPQQPGATLWQSRSGCRGAHPPARSAQYCWHRLPAGGTDIQHIELRFD